MINPDIKCSKQMATFLYMLSVSELPLSLANDPDKCYRVNVGSTDSKPILFDSFKTHPGISISFPKLGIKSDAAGRYQIMGWIYRAYAKPSQLNLPDFSPLSQDKIAIKLIRECRAIDDIEAGRIKSAINKCRSRWASLPGAGYKQNEHSINMLIDVFKKAGGTVID
ncbi:putative lysin [Serratia phage vB_SmaS_Opt-169]|nr:putative lysin [Serratia phage vB_SmaS_Opt-169]